MARADNVTALNSRAAALFAAGATLIAGLAAPPLALLCVAAAAADSLIRMRAGAPRLEWTALAPPLLGAGLVAVAVGFDAAVGFIFVWRIWADASWSAREAARLAGMGGARGLSRRDRLALAATPLFALSVTAYTAPHMLAGLPLDLPHAPLLVPLLCGFAAALIAGDWALQRLAEARLGLAAHAPVLHIAAHQVVFLAAYVLSPDLSAGLMAVIVWRMMSAARQASLTAVP